MRFAAQAKAACGVACGRLGWPPAEFWAATPADLMLALEGLLPPDRERPVTAGELQALMEAGDG